MHTKDLGVKPASGSPSRVFSFSPDDPVPSRAVAMRGLAPWLQAVGPARIRFRVRLTWADASTRSGRRDEIRTFADPRPLLGLLQRIAATPHRPLIAVRIEANVWPRWTEVSRECVVWAACKRESRDEKKRARSGS